MCDWLPDLIPLQSNDADGWRAFENEVYDQFNWDFVESKPVYEGKPVYINLAKDGGREVSFWHCVTRAYEETRNRELEPQRAERIGWVRAAIEGASKDGVRVWDVHRKGGRLRRLIWVSGADYLVVLNHDTKVWWLVTAYPTTEDHTRRKLEKSWSESQNG